MRSVGRPVRRTVARAAGFIAAACCGALALTTPKMSPWMKAAAEHAQQPTPAVSREEQQARTACGGCHAFPPPDILPRQAWRNEIVKMFFIRENRLPPIAAAGSSAVVPLPPDLEQALAYYASGAAERLPPPDSWPSPGDGPLTFARSDLAISEMSGPPAVSNIHLTDLDGDGQLDVLGADMRQGIIFAGRPTRGTGGLSIVASIPHPSHVTPIDVDRDGALDLLVGDLGEFFPADHDKGAVIWLRGLGKGKYGAFWLDGWPRVAAVQAADFNGDGRNDLAVAAFGWRKSGEVTIVENRTTVASRPAFTNHKIDPRTGGLAVWPVDLDRDGRMDLVTLLAQEHETIVAYLNRGGDGFSFEQRVIYVAPHPNWGSSGMQMVDLDKDGDLDVLLTHGDTFDDGIVKPYHGIQWLENTGGYPFVEHTLARMPGVHSAQAADLDGDGDLDVVAAALLAGGSDVDERTLPALVWLEQTKAGTFARHTIEMGFPRHATLDLGDIDADGDIDIVVGNFSLDRSAAASVDVWTNQRTRR